MPDSILYERALPHGPVVRIRRTTVAGAAPVTAVLEVDRRAGTPRASAGGTPPPLATAIGASEEAVLEKLEPLASSDAEIARLLRARGLR